MIPSHTPTSWPPKSVRPSLGPGAERLEVLLGRAAELEHPHSARLSTVIRPPHTAASKTATPSGRLQRQPGNANCAVSVFCVMTINSTMRTRKLTNKAVHNAAARVSLSGDTGGDMGVRGVAAASGRACCGGIVGDSAAVGEVARLPVGRYGRARPRTSMWQAYPMPISQRLWPMCSRPPSPTRSGQAKLTELWDPVELLDPEWRYPQKPTITSP